MSELIVISGPSGVGKGTIVNEILRRRPQTSLSVSCTTRAPREGEKEGVSYFFISKEEFEKDIQKGGFLEYSQHFGNFYGTPAAFVEEKLKTGGVILEIDVDGALAVKDKRPSAVLIMIAPPSKEELYKRLKGRGTESEDVIKKRLERVDYELSKSGEYNYVIINDDLNAAVEMILNIIDKENK